MSVVPFRPHAARVVDLDTLRRDRAITDARMELDRLKVAAMVARDQIDAELDRRQATLMAQIRGAQWPVYDTDTVEELHVRLAEAAGDWRTQRRHWHDRWRPILTAAYERAYGPAGAAVLTVPASRRPDRPGGDAA